MACVSACMGIAYYLTGVINDLLAANLSIHLTKLEEAGYIRIDKKFVNKKPLTLCSITKRGSSALHAYLDMVTEFATIRKKIAAACHCEQIFVLNFGSNPVH